MRKSAILSLVFIAVITMLIIISSIIDERNNKINLENYKNAMIKETDVKNMENRENITEKLKNPRIGGEVSLRIGVPNVNLPPMIMWDGDNTLTGFEIDLIAETAKRLGVLYEIVPINPGTEQENLENGSIDMAWGNISDTDKKRLTYDLTEPYINIPQVIVIYDGSGIKEKKDIKNISVIMSTPAESLADNDKIEIEFKKMSALKDYKKTFKQLRDGYSDAVICDMTTAVYMQKADKKLNIIDEKAAEVKYSVAFSFDKDKMRITVDQVLKDMEKSGFLAELSQKWFEKDYCLK